MFAPDIPVPLEDLMGWLKGGINPTCKWAAEVIEQQQAEIARLTELVGAADVKLSNEELYRRAYPDGPGNVNSGKS